MSKLKHHSKNGTPLRLAVTCRCAAAYNLHISKAKWTVVVCDLYVNCSSEQSQTLAGWNISHTQTLSLTQVMFKLSCCVMYDRHWNRAILLCTLCGFAIPVPVLGGGDKCRKWRLMSRRRKMSFSWEISHNKLKRSSIWPALPSSLTSQHYDVVYCEVDTRVMHKTKSFHCETPRGIPESGFYQPGTFTEVSVTTSWWMSAFPDGMKKANLSLS